MEVIDATQGHEDLAATLDRVTHAKERVIVCRLGKPIAAVIPIEDLELLERLIEEAEDRLDIEDAERMLNDPDEEWIPRDQVRVNLGL